MPHIFLLSLLFGLSFSGHALGQSSPTKPNAEPPEVVDPPLGTETPSKRLEKDDGVLRPKPGVDPTIVKPAPEIGPHSTPVIPPPENGAK